MWLDFLHSDPQSDPNLWWFEGLDHTEGPSACLEFASGGVPSEGYGHDGHGVCPGDGQTEVYLKVMSMTALVCTWAMDRRRSIWRIWALRDWRLPRRWPDGGLSEIYEHYGPGVYLDDGQTQAEGIPSQGEGGDALLRRMHLTPDLALLQVE